MAVLKLQSPRCSGKVLIFHQHEASRSVPSASLSYLMTAEAQRIRLLYSWVNEQVRNYLDRRRWKLIFF